MQRAAHSIHHIIIALCAAVLLAVVLAPRAHAATGGIRIAPAAVRLELTKGAAEVVTSITITNTYAVPVTLHFSVERLAQNVSHTVDPTTLISLQTAELTVASSQSGTQTVTLHDSAQLSPGSQMAELVVTEQAAGPGAGVGVQPAVRLPITIIKDDGAIASLGLTKVAGPGFAVGMPQTVAVTIRNTGNVIAIPHGLVTIRNPRGALVGQGTINAASAALLPGSEKTISVPITPMAAATVPGSYHINVAYGLGGDAATKASDASFLYVAWWHLAGTVMIISLLLLLVRVWRICLQYILSHRKKLEPVPLAAAPAKRRVLVGRNG